MRLRCGYDACSFAAGRSGGEWAEPQRLTVALTATSGVLPATHISFHFLVNLLALLYSCFAMSSHFSFGLLVTLTLFP